VKGSVDEILAGALWRLGDLMPLAICARVIARAQREGFRRAHRQWPGRRNHEVFLDWPALRALLTGRLRRYAAALPALPLAQAALGERLECYRYGIGDAIDAHTDAPCLIAGALPADFTLVIYLDEGAGGGETLFPADGLRVKPAAGSALLFSKTLQHAAAEVRAGTKHVLRADVGYGPTPKVCAQAPSAPMRQMGADSGPGSASTRPTPASAACGTSSGKRACAASAAPDT
jgi:hypothetical protein